MRRRYDVEVLLKIKEENSHYNRGIEACKKEYKYISYPLQRGNI
jgi:hypothetical protein